MNDYKIVIDAGHGGSDPGAVGKEIIEKDLVLDISQLQYDRFKELGVPVYMTRDTDETLDPDTRTQRVLDAFGNDPNVIVLSNHINAGGGDGAEVIYALRNDDTLSQLILNQLGLAGQNIRRAYQRQSTNDPNIDYYFMHRETGDTESVIVEYGFLDSTGDDIEQLLSDYEIYAEAVVKAVTEYIGIPYEDSNLPELENTYVVKSGDTLWSIAKKFNTTVDAIKKVNNLDSNLLSIDQILKLPGGEYIEYIVVPGDTLWAISSRYGITVEQLVSYNNLKNNILSINQVLKIPTDVTYDDYIVVKGDSLYGIARTFNTTVDELKSINNLKSDLLSIGQIIKVPIK